MYSKGVYNQNKIATMALLKCSKNYETFLRWQQSFSSKIKVKAKVYFSHCTNALNFQ
jgi:hypothetical protein